MCRSTLSSTSALDGVDGQRQASEAQRRGRDTVPSLYEAEWVPQAGLDGCGKSRPHRDSISGPSRR